MINKTGSMTDCTAVDSESDDAETELQSVEKNISESHDTWRCSVHLNHNHCLSPKNLGHASWGLV
jgi:hypothetical protein